ncbi:hypothetical protein N7444_002717 [Penicillium canescens]|nr:hypothetical protein N7444_002717 [Penicillium canescens]
MGGDLNLKKSWHPSLLKNQERVWAQEKRALEERKQIDQLRPPPRSLRKREATEPRRLDVPSPSSATGHYSEEMEGYLLGKRRIDGVILKNDADTKKLEKGSEVVGNDAAAGPSVGSARDTMLKVMADPLLEVKKREQAAYEAMVKEAMRRKEREEKRAQGGDGGRDRGKERDRRHRTHDSKRRRYSDDAGDERRDRHHRRSSPRRHRSRSPASGDRHHRHRSERERERHDDERRGDNRDNRDRRSDDTRSRRDDRDRGRDRRDHQDKTDSYSRHQDRDDRRDRGREGREGDRSSRRYSRSPRPSGDRNGRPPPTEDRRRDFPRREFNNRRDSGRDNGAPSAHPPANKPDPKEIEEERRRKLAEMQSNATDMEVDRRQRITDITAKEEQQQEADDRQRSDRGRFMSDMHKRVQEDSLDERIRRSRGGLERMDED